MDVKYPHITVRLVGTDSNSFAMVAAVAKEVRRVEGKAAADALISEAFDSSSPDELLSVLMRTVSVI